MGFFKNIGNFIKKNTKFISLQNAIKVAGSFDPTGLVSGINGAVQADKQAREDASAQAQADAQQAQANLAQTSRTIAGNVVSSLGSGLVAGASDGVNHTAGVAGASVINQSIKVWFHNNWKWLTGTVVGLIAVIWAFRHFSHKGHPIKRLAYRR